MKKRKKPKVDLIEGLSPAISIEQKNTPKNPRSTVATVTEIYDYMRVLYARAGTPYSPFTGKPIKSQSVAEIVDRIKNLQFYRHNFQTYWSMGQVVLRLEWQQASLRII